MSDTKIGPLGDSLTKTSKAGGRGFEADAGDARESAAFGRTGIAAEYQLTQTLQDLSSAANAVHELADMLQRNPSVLVRGRFTPGEAK